MEIDTGETQIRAAVVEAAEECGYWDDGGVEPGQEPDEKLAPTSNERAEWGCIIEVLSDGVLEDYNFEMENRFADMPPEQSGALKRKMNIDHDYFVAVVEDPTPARWREIEQELSNLIGTTSSDG
jgi:hypothetical protein